MEFDKLKLFQSRDEKINLAAGAFFLIMALLEVKFGRPVLFGLRQYHWNFFADFFFLGVLHVAFTYALIGSSRQLSEWTIAKTKLINAQFISVVSAAALIGFALIHFSFPGQWQDGRSDGHQRIAADLLMIVMFAWPAFHALSQIKGLSLQYNRLLSSQREFCPSDKRRARMCESVERSLFALLFFSRILSRLDSGRFMQTYSDLGYFPGVDLFWAGAVGPIISLACSTGLVLTSLCFPDASRSGKTFYLLRVFLVPIADAGYITGLFGITAAHGLEYFFVGKQMVSNAKMDTHERRRFRFLFAGLTPLLGLTAVAELCLQSGVIPHQTLAMSAARIAVQIQILLFWGHYIIDGMMFRMRDERTKHFVGPLLTPRGPLST